MRVLLTRPIEASQLLAGKIHTLGLQVDMAPMLEITLKPEAVQLDGAAALVYTSKNAVMAFKESGQKFEGLIFAVGDATADYVRALGCGEVIAASGDVKSLIACVRSHANNISGLILHLSGEDTRGDLVGDLAKAGLNVTRKIVYKAEPAREIEAQIRERIKLGKYTAILFFSPRSARTFMSFLEKNDMNSNMKAVSAIVMSEAVASEAKTVSWSEIMVADKPDEEAMMECLKLLKEGHLDKEK